MKRILTMAFALMLCVGVFVPGVGANTEDYDYTSEIARWKKAATLPTTSLENVAAVKDKLYVMGNTIKLNIFDLKTKKWTVGRDIIADVNYAATATVNDKIYIMGGVDGKATSLVQIYDTKTNTWSPGSRMPGRIYSAACAAVGDNIYTFGGYMLDEKGNSRPISSTYVYNTKTDTWSSGAMVPGSARREMRACAVGKKVYVMGGRIDGTTFTTQMYAYDTETDTWGEANYMPNNGKLKTAVSIGDDIYTICNLGDNTSKQIDVFNTTTKTWSVNTKTWPRGAELPENSEIIRALAINGTIYAMDAKNILSIEAAPATKTSDLSLGLNVGQSIQLNGTGELADDTNLTWTSSDSTVASVDNTGKVTALKKGSANISAKNAGGTVQQSIAITVTEPEPAQTAPVVTDVKWKDTGAAVTATSDKKIAMYGVSATKDPNAATWKKSNVFSNIKVGATYYFFAKDEEGNISEPFAFQRAEE